jgi:hypothetical protein
MSEYTERAFETLAEMSRGRLTANDFAKALRVGERGNYFDADEIVRIAATAGITEDQVREVVQTSNRATLFEIAF